MATGRHYRLGFLQDFPCFYRPNATHPKRITAIISQNGNAYEEGLSEGWNPIQKYWRDPRVEERTTAHQFFVCRRLTGTARQTLLLRNRMTFLLKQVKQLLYMLLSGTEVHRIDAKPGLTFEFRG